MNTTWMILDETGCNVILDLAFLIYDLLQIKHGHKI